MVFAGIFCMFLLMVGRERGYDVTGREMTLCGGGRNVLKQGWLGPSLLCEFALYGHLVAADIVAFVFLHGDGWIEIPDGGEELDIHPLIICKGEYGDGSTLIAVGYEDLTTIQLIGVGHEISFVVNAETDFTGGGVILAQIQLEQLRGLAIGECFGGVILFSATPEEQEAEEKGEESFHYIFSGASKPKRSMHSSRARFARATKAM